MSISKIQRNRKIKDFADELVKKGIEPNNYELNNKLREHFDNHVMGMPYYSPKKQIPYEESSKDDYNHNFLTFQEDIETAYEANIETNNKAVSIQEYYDTEKKKVQHSIDKVALRVKNLEDSLKNNKRIQEHVEVFDSLYNIELYGKEERNIPYTTSFVDLLQRKVCTEKTNAQVNKLSIERANISILGLENFQGYTTEGEIGKVLNDTINDVFIFIGQSSDNEPKSLNILLDLGKLINFNTVFFKSTSSNDMTFTLALSDDGNSFYSVYDITGKDLVEWNFEPKDARYLKITCTKKEADGQATNSQGFNIYEYYYIIKNITIALEAYESKSILVTKPIEFDNLTNFIRLDASDNTYAETNINYFIGFDNGIDKIGWDAIKNHDDHLLFMFEKKHKIINPGIQDGYGLQSPLTGLYKLYRLPSGVNTNSIKVFAGYNMWHIKKYSRIIGDYDDGFDLKDSDVTELIQKCTMQESFIDCENYNNYEIASNKLYIFTQYVDCKETDSIYNKSIKLCNPTGDYEADNYEDVRSVIRIFVNGYEQITGSNGMYSFNLKKGMNKIQIAIYYPQSIVTKATLVHDINFKALTNDVFAKLPMKYTNVSMLNKSLEPTYDYYTIQNNTIYLNIDPTEIITNYNEDMGFFLTYYGLKENMQRYFVSNKLKFRIMAILNSKNKNVSPSINSFRITGK